MFKDAKDYDMSLAGKSVRPKVEPKAKLYKGKTYKQWAQELGVHTETIRGHLKIHGHLKYAGVGKGKPGFAGHPNNKQKYYKGKTYKEWAQELGVHSETVGYHHRTYGHLNKVGIRKYKKKIDKSIKVC